MDMDPRIADKLLDRIVELSKGNEERTMEYLMAQSTGAERQRKYAEKCQAEGKRQTYLWLDDTDAAALKRAYPGQRGGINWKAVIAAALIKADEKSE